MNQAIIQAQKELIEFYEHMIRKTGNNYKWLDADVNKGEDLRCKITELSSLPSDTQWIDAIKRVQSLIDIELYDHDGASINASYLRGLEDALGEIKGEPPERNIIS